MQDPAGGRLRFHDLRHSAATILLAAGVPERVVMEILGHSTLAMVKRYQHVLPGLRSPLPSAWTACCWGAESYLIRRRAVR